MRSRTGCVTNLTTRYIQTADELSYTQEHNHCPDSAAIDIDIEKNISFHPFSRKVSVGECRRVSVSFRTIVCDLSCRPVVVSVSWLSVKKCRR